MLSYKDYEKKVYDWLIAKNQEDPDFTFSLRRNGTKGAQVDYFIGTEKSNYFGTTFWAIRVGFPGSTGDCIDVIFGYAQDDFTYKIEFTQTNSPVGDQNISVLNLIKSLKDPISKALGLKYESGTDNKIFTIIPKTPKDKYSSLDEMLNDLESDLDILIPMVNEYIEVERKNNPNFKAHRISQKEFKEMHDSMAKRIIKYSDPGQKIEQGISDIQYWLYSPGENASQWDEFYDAGIMCLAWDDLGDLNKYGTREEIKKALIDAYGGEGDKKNDVSANDDFFNKMNIGDFVIVKRGRAELLGYGVVASNYYYDENRLYFKSCRKVDWKIKGSWNVSHNMVVKTLTDITPYKSDHPDYGKYYEWLLGTMNENHVHKTPESMKFPLNTILYGPPGTGKTYQTLLKAAEIVAMHPIENYTEAKRIFNEKLGDQIEFITFHQNYSYEDFIQGLRPDIENGKELTFERKDGVFKVIADRALKNITASEQPPIAKKTFDQAFDEFANPLDEGEVEEIEVKMKKVSYFITAITNKSIEFRKTSGGTEHTLSISTLRKMYDAESVLDIQGLASYYKPLLKELLKIGKDSSGRKEIVQRKNYVIIIDEINRANISRVFGELITLIEPDKRSHGAIPLKCTLPSGEEFVVPSNLYIIGTMNTADKSIALLDIALRRRFVFEPMYPKYEIANQLIHDVEVLQKINKKIIDLKGHDFQIGHAYFMNDNHDLLQRFNTKVIPLLLEYFMNDEKEVKGILQDAGLALEADTWPLKIIGLRDQSL